jgi:MFS family permease
MAGKSGYGSVQSSLYRRRSSLEVYKTFLEEFNAATGAQLVTLLGFLTALGIGGLIGTVPQVVTQRFAEIHYGLEDGIQCSEFRADKPHACSQGSDYAQSAASYMMLVRNLLALLSNSLAGSYSDTHGRRGASILIRL